MEQSIGRDREGEGPIGLDGWTDVERKDERTERQGRAPDQALRGAPAGHLVDSIPSLQSAHAPHYTTA